MEGQSSDLEQSINVGFVTKSWRAAPKKCNPNKTLPGLRLSDTRDCDRDRDIKHSTEFETIPFICYLSRPTGCWWKFIDLSSSRPLPRYPWRYSQGCSNSIQVVKGAAPSTYFFWDPVMRFSYSLPPWDARIPCHCAVLSSSPSDQRNRNYLMVIVFTGTSHPAFLFHKLAARVFGEHDEWMKQDSTLIDLQVSKESQGHPIQFTNAMGSRGKFYALSLSLQGTLAVIEDVDSLLKITALGTKRAVPTVSSKHFREYLLESDEEISLTFLVSKKSVNVVDDVEVF
ncbi:hypothetical protein CJ030_MR7G013552 [Morella rubra]|uniref:Uncharacterized protein n=1 Tax=Morella rubra TaxID=262757 RepID=A0A6A1V270_9ROSI|nr:hypothetical protein CJ030_MR7G013557 [Morella rubra]KAB1206701.1 hypothetical protein CJ030_MR7G013552 [Morella rubra]